ncbi:MAG: DUF4236 domain-containing protein [Oxalobacteraceae bacterium]|nr:MAG: DUF4236 domain-containing protein [Oxalobacteraceae bacterium]
MGLTFSKSVRFGAVRFNLSGSGIGVSAGIPGLRVGTGPRGAYITGGVGGFRYRKSFSGNAARRTGTVLSPAAPSPKHQPTTPSHSANSNIISEVQHDTKHVLVLGDSNHDALLESMNEQRKRAKLWPFFSAALAVGLWILFNTQRAWPTEVFYALGVLWLLLTLWMRHRDAMKRLTVLFYDPDPRTCNTFENLGNALVSASTVKKLKAIASTSSFADKRYSAGAGQGLKFQNASFAMGQAPGVLANIDVPILTTSGTTLAFYPDRVLAFRAGSVGGIDYQRLDASSESTRFIEEEAVPSDATIIDRTWKFVNKNGTPDKRFKNNHELPICHYNQMNLSTPGGLDIRLLGSRANAFDDLARAVKTMRP